MSPGSALPTVLVVDDDRLNRVALAELLQEECRILLARDGMNALEILARELVDLVLLDVSMPGMDGYEVIRRITADKALADIPVIFITASADPESEERGLLLGAADFVQKPIRPVVVRTRVLAHLKLALQRRELLRLAGHDSLTGLANRRTFDTMLAERLGRAGRGGERVAVALFDVDHFKLYNDCYGHAAGDAALRQVAQILQSFARRSGDLVARYGGEEFALLLSGSGEPALALNGISAAVADAQIAHVASPTADFLTISGGAVTDIPPPQEAALLLERADQLLYRAKASGRNQVLCEVFGEVAGTAGRSESAS